ncbi:MAG: type II/IV secretion system protein [Rickettsiales bacterium]
MTVLLPPPNDSAFMQFLQLEGPIAAPLAQYIQKEAGLKGTSLIATAFSSGVVTERQSAELLAKKFDCALYDLPPLRPGENRLFKETLPVPWLMRQRAVPFSLEGSSLSVAVADPLALEHTKRTIAQAKQASMIAGSGVAFDKSAGIDYAKYDTAIYVSTLTAMENYLQSLSGVDAPRSGPNVTEEGKQHVPSPRDAVMRSLMRREGAKAAPRKVFSAGSDVIQFVNEVIKEAVERRASDVHIEKFEKKARIRFRCDGVLKDINEHEDFLFRHYSSVTTRIKILASMDISEKRLPQDGGIAFQHEKIKVEIRASILPAIHGERVVMRIVDQKASQFKMADLGLEPKPFALLKKAAFAPQGMVLVTGPTGSGKSTTLYAILKERNTEDVNILTAEDPVEFELEGVGQVRVREDIGLTFSAALRSFLRQDPEMIMVGEIRDKETCDIAVKAALTGHLVLSTLHTNDAAGTITRLLNMGVPSYLITASVTAIVAQRLVRVNCKECSVPDETDPRERLLAIGMKEGEAATATPFVGKGCSACDGTGARGRMAVHEVLYMTPRLKEAILRDANEIELREAAEKDGFVDMQSVARMKVAAGKTSIQEFLRTMMV